MCGKEEKNYGGGCGKGCKGNIINLTEKKAKRKENRKNIVIVCVHCTHE